MSHPQGNHTLALAFPRRGNQNQLFFLSCSPRLSKERGWGCGSSRQLKGQSISIAKDFNHDQEIMMGQIGIVYENAAIAQAHIVDRKY
jgi:hypothetical protein